MLTNPIANGEDRRVAGVNGGFSQRIMACVEASYLLSLLCIVSLPHCPQPQRPPLRSAAGCGV